MNKLIRLCKGIVRIRVTGYAPERFMNMCHKNGIQLVDIVCLNHGYEMDLKASDFFLIKKFLKKTGTKVKIIKKTGAPFFVFRYRKHLFFPIGIGIAFLFLVIMAQFLWEIEILGNDRITDYQMMTYLQEEDIHTGIPLRSISCEDLEEQIRKDYPDIAWISVRIEGTRMVMDIQEVKSNEPESTMTNASIDYDQNEYPRNEQNNPLSGTDLVASHNGTVISIITRKGTPMVKIGDEVIVGDVLVSGCKELFDDYGTVIDYTYCDAQADILIAFQEDYVDTIDINYQKYEKTQKQRTGWKFILPKRRITLGFIKPKYEYYQIYTIDQQVIIGDKFRFPIVAQRYLVEELAIRKAKHTEKEIEEIAKKHFALYSKKLDKKGFQIIDKDGKIKVNGEKVQVLGTLEIQYLEKERQATQIRSLEIEEGIEQDGIDSDSNGNSS